MLAHRSRHAVRIQQVRPLRKNSPLGDRKSTVNENTSLCVGNEFELRTFQEVQKSNIVFERLLYRQLKKGSIDESPPFFAGHVDVNAGFQNEKRGEGDFAGGNMWEDVTDHQR